MKHRLKRTTCKRDYPTCFRAYSVFHPWQLRSSLLRSFGDELSHLFVELLGVGAVFFGIQAVNSGLGSLGQEAIGIILSDFPVITKSGVQVSFALGRVISFGNAHEGFLRLGR